MKLIPATKTLPDTGCDDYKPLLKSFKFLERNCTLYDLYRKAWREENIQLTMGEFRRVLAIQQSFVEAVRNNYNYEGFTRMAIWSAYNKLQTVVSRYYYELAMRELGNKLKVSKPQEPAQLNLPIDPEGV